MATKATTKKSTQPSRRAYLDNLSDQLKGRMSQGATEPLAVAQTIVELAKDWAKFQSEANGLSCGAWLEQTFGRGKNLLWFTRRHEAVKAIGEHAKSTWDHDAAVWATSRIQDKRHLRTLDKLVTKARTKNGGNPIGQSAVQRLAREAKLVAPAKPHACTRCMLLEQALVKALKRLRARSRSKQASRQVEAKAHPTERTK